MKKVFLIALAAALLFSLPMTTHGKTEFDLGGYIRLDALWNSSQFQNHNLTAFEVRDNVLNSNHGRLLMNANNSRFNFTIKGPELWGGKVTGLIEVDFDGSDTIVAGTIGVSTNASSFNQAKLRLRHAMFKITWPDREILFGQYWSINSELIPETADSGAYTLHGNNQLRLPQIRYTQIFTDYFNASLAICSPQNGRWGLNLDATNPLEGETSETPMVELKLRYEQVLYGKAAWNGKPRAFYVGLGAGYNRTRSIATTFTPGNWRTLGQDNYFTVTGVLADMTINRMKYDDHWIFMFENFTPIIPTMTKNLAGTLALAQKWWIGQGLSTWRLDLPAGDRFYTWNGTFTNATDPNYDLTFLKRYGGWAQLQYYWTNEIYTNLNFGFEKAFGFNNQTNNSLTNLAGVFPGQPGFIYATPTGFDPVNSTWRASVTQWYRPVPAVKFAVQYTYSRTNFFQRTTVGTGVTDYGNCHTLLANAWYLF